MRQLPGEVTETRKPNTAWRMLIFPIVWALVILWINQASYRTGAGHYIWLGWMYAPSTYTLVVTAYPLLLAFLFTAAMLAAFVSGLEIGRRMQK